MNVALCSLFERDYHYGLAALANSLVETGASGQLFAGYRGPLPPWVHDLAITADGERTRVQLSSEFELVFVPLTTAVHLANYKADFLLRVATELSPGADSVAYFDPDITAMIAWSVFADWTSVGITCCADIKPWMPPLHPIRIQWRKLLSDQGLAVRQDHFFYYNSGYMGFARATWPAISLLRQINAEVCRRNHRSDVLVMSNTRSHPYFLTDQDAFNIMLMATEHPIAWTGPDGMNFAMRGGGFMFNHAVNQVKPWRRRYLRETLRGRCISPADAAYWKHLDGAIKPYPAKDLRRRRRIVHWACLWQRLRGVPPHQ